MQGTHKKRDVISEAAEKVKELRLYKTIIVLYNLFLILKIFLVQFEIIEIEK